MHTENQSHLLQAILKQIKASDPGMRQLIEERIRESKKKGKQKDISKEIIRRLRIQNKKLLEQVASLREQLKSNSTDSNQIKNKLNDLVKLNDSLADALGSCNTCWGNDPHCTNCAGEGVPGWKKINKRMFNLYVLPTLEKMYGRGK